MHLGALALDGHFVDRYSVGEQLLIESYSVFVFFFKAVHVEVAEVDFSRADLSAFERVDQLFDKGFCRAAVESDMVNSHVHDHTAV